MRKMGRVATNIVHYYYAAAIVSLLIFACNVLRKRIVILFVNEH